MYDICRHFDYFFARIGSLKAEETLPFGAQLPALLDSAFYIFLHLRTKRSLRNAFANERDESARRRAVDSGDRQGGGGPRALHFISLIIIHTVCT